MSALVNRVVTPTGLHEAAGINGLRWLPRPARREIASLVRNGLANLFATAPPGMRPLFLALFAGGGR